MENFIRIAGQCNSTFRFLHLEEQNWKFKFHQLAPNPGSPTGTNFVVSIYFDKISISVIFLTTRENQVSTYNMQESFVVFNYNNTALTVGSHLKKSEINSLWIFWNTLHVNELHFLHSLKQTPTLLHFQLMSITMSRVKSRREPSSWLCIHFSGLPEISDI